MAAELRYCALPARLASPPRRRTHHHARQDIEFVGLGVWAAGVWAARLTPSPLRRRRHRRGALRSRQRIDFAASEALFQWLALMDMRPLQWWFCSAYRLHLEQRRTVSRLDQIVCRDAFGSIVGK